MENKFINRVSAEAQGASGRPLMNEHPSIHFLLVELSNPRQIHTCSSIGTIKKNEKKQIPRVPKGCIVLAILLFLTHSSEKIYILLAVELISKAIITGAILLPNYRLLRFYFGCSRRKPIKERNKE